MLRRLWAVIAMDYGNGWGLVMIAGFVFVCGMLPNMIRESRDQVYLRSILPNPAGQLAEGTLVELVHVIDQDNPPDQIKNANVIDQEVKSLEPLTALMALEYLDLSRCGFENGIEKLPELPNLKTLFLPKSLLNNKAVLEQLAKYAELQELVINPWESKEVDDKEISDIANVLNDHSSLKRVFLGPAVQRNSNGHNRDSYLTNLQNCRRLDKKCFSCAVLPSVDEEKVWFTFNHFLYLFYSIQLPGLLLTKLRYFSSPEGILTPNVLLPHTLVTLVMLAGIPFLFAWIYLNGVYQYLALLSVFLFPISFVCLSWLLVRVHFYFLFGPFLFSFIIFNSLLMSWERPFSIYLMGGYPQIEKGVWSWISISLVFLPLICKQIMHLMREVAFFEMKSNQFLGIDFKKLHVYNSRRKSSSNIPIKDTLRDQNVLAAIDEYHKNPDSRHRLTLWRSGNRFRGTLMFLWTACVLVGVDILLSLAGISGVWEPGIEQAVMALLISLLPYFYVLGPVRIWFRRALVMSYQSCLPISRKELRTEILQSVLLDTLPLMAGSLLLVFWAGVKASSPSFMYSLKSITATIFVISSLCGFGSIITWGMWVLRDTFNRHQIIKNLCLISPVPTLFVIYLLAHYSGISSKSLTEPVGLLCLGCVFLIIDLALFRFIWKYLDRKEWGLQ